MISSNSNTCQNCKNSFTGNFCANCGQRKQANDRLRFKELSKDFVDNVFNIHKGLFYTFWQLLKAPGKTGRAFIRGKRKDFTNPIRYLIIAVAIQAFIDYWFIHPELDEAPGFIYFAFLSEEINRSMAWWNHILATRYSFIHNLSMIFTFPLAYTVLFRKQGYNFTELLTVNFYYFATGLIVTILSIFGTELLSSSKLPIPIIILVTMGYVFWSSIHFFNKVHIGTRILLILISILFFMLFRVFMVTYLLSVFFPV